jgi:hypothetical protein
MVSFRRDKATTESLAANAPLNAIVPPDKSDGRRRLRFEEAVGGSSG